MFWLQCVPVTFVQQLLDFVQRDGALDRKHRKEQVFLAGVVVKDLYGNLLPAAYGHFKPEAPQGNLVFCNFRN